MPTEFLRGVLGIIGLGCAYMTGRSFVAVRKGWQKISKLYGWILRTVVCLFAVIFRHPVDIVVIVIWSLAILSIGMGAWGVSRTRPPEDLSHELIPDTDEDANPHRT